MTAHPGAADGSAEKLRFQQPARQPHDPGRPSGPKSVTSPNTRSPSVSARPGEISLRLPQAFLPPREIGLEVHPTRQAEWLRTLPLANTEPAAGELLGRIEQIVTAELKPSQRMELLAGLEESIHSLTDALSDRYSQASLPLSPRNLKRLMLALRLNNELARGYRIVFHEGVRSRSNGSLSRTLVEAGFRAMAALSRLLLESYLVYRDEPPGLWGVIHQIYLHLEPHPSALERTFSLTGGEEMTPAALYRRILLLAMANPPHLMQGEANIVWKWLRQWQEGCRLTPLPEDGLSPGAFIVDLRADAPPLFHRRDTLVDAPEPRMIQVLPLLRALDRKLEELNAPNAAARAGASPLTIRLQRNMLGRLRSAWGRNEDRLHPRTAALGSVAMTIGLMSCHYHISDEAQFEPDQSEIRILSGGGERTSDSWELVPMDFEPWRVEQAEASLNYTTEPSGQDPFANKEEITDIWERVYLHKAKKKHKPPLAVTRQSDLMQQLLSWSRKNVSCCGLCLHTPPRQGMAVRVGELVAYRPDQKEEGDGWVVGAIRWLRVHPDNSLEMGILLLATLVEPVAVRGVEGTGKGGSYQRALLQSAGDSLNKKGSLITPAAIYDVGSRLLVNLGDTLQYVRLTELRETSRSFSQFLFQPLELPEQELRQAHNLQSMSNVLD